MLEQQVLSFCYLKIIFIVHQLRSSSQQNTTQQQTQLTAMQQLLLQQQQQQQLSAVIAAQQQQQQQEQQQTDNGSAGHQRQTPLNDVNDKSKLILKKIIFLACSHSLFKQQ